MGKNRKVSGLPLIYIMYIEIGRNIEKRKLIWH